MRISVLAVAGMLVLLTSLSIAKPPREPDPDHMPPPGAAMPKLWLPRDTEGWTLLKPAADARILYVSSREGNDATAQIYEAGQTAVGADPFSPAGEVRPFKTIPAAMEQARANQPDWVLLKRGDSWRDVSLRALQGRSKSEPSVLGAYGTAAERPVISGRTASMSLGSASKGIDFAVVTGIELYCSYLDPVAPDYRQAGEDENRRGKSGISLSVGPQGGMANVLVEDCMLRFAALSIGGPAGRMTDVVVRRTCVADAYVPSGHNQGMWGSHASILLEECLFDHDGWLHQATPANRGKPGLASLLSHDVYCTQMYSTIFRNNLFLRASSIGNKFTANYGPGSVKSVVLDNNLYVEGEIGVSMGGNTSAPLRWVDCKVTNNVLLDIGRGQPTGRILGWGVDATDWDGGEISGNLFLRQQNDAVRNVWGLSIGSEDGGEAIRMRNVTIRGNVFNGLRNARTAMNIKNAALMEGITISDNLFQFAGVPSTLIRADALGAGLKFRGNIYDSAAAPGRWFVVGGMELTLDEWVRQSGEQGAQQKKIEFPDAGRAIETYMKSLGKPATFDAFIAEVRKQSKANWRPELSAPVINDWIREGFAVTKIAAEKS